MSAHNRKRKKVAADIVASVLYRSRRRCCLCWGIRGDRTEKRGQIAHLDHDPSNESEENLAFLCLAHHDEYDTVGSQAKGMTLKELKRYRDGMYLFLSQTPERIPAREAGELQGPFCLVTGDSATITNVQGDLNIRVSAGRRRTRDVVIAGTIAENPAMCN
jgi:hypothetical protein